MNPASVYIIVPVYNEQPVLRATIQSLLASGFSIVVIDDGSATALHDEIHDLPIYYLRHSVNLGQGAALQTGSTFALQQGAAYMIHFDADGQHSANDLEAMVKPLLQDEVDIVFGSRFAEKKKMEIPWMKQAVIHAGRYLNFLFTGILLSDAHNGFRSMNRKAAEKISITENRMSHASEILFLVKQHRLRYREVPVSITYTDYSKKKGQSVWNSIRIVFDLLLHKLFQ
jgi:glycosyltransferase involved in cell wall biosynthesis